MNYSTEVILQHWKFLTIEFQKALLEHLNKLMEEEELRRKIRREEE